MAGPCGKLNALRLVSVFAAARNRCRGRRQASQFLQTHRAVSAALAISDRAARATSRAQDTTEKPMAMSLKRIRAAREELTRLGVLVDSGQKVLNPRTGEWEICGS